MSLSRILTYAAVLLAGFLWTCFSLLFPANPRWNLNPLLWLTPWLAAGGLILAAAVTRRNRWPFLPSIAAGLCVFQLVASQTMWGLMDWERMNLSWPQPGGPLEYYIEGITGNDQEGYIQDAGGMRALPSLGSVGYWIFFTNLALWAVSTTGVWFAARSFNLRRIEVRGIRKPDGVIRRPPVRKW